MLKLNDAKLNKPINEHDSTDGLACIMASQKQYTHHWLLNNNRYNSVWTCISIKQVMYTYIHVSSIKWAMYMDFMFTDSTGGIVLYMHRRVSCTSIGSSSTTHYTDVFCLPLTHTPCCLAT